MGPLLRLSLLHIQSFPQLAVATVTGCFHMRLKHMSSQLLKGGKKTKQNKAVQQTFLEAGKVHCRPCSLHGLE